MDKTLLDNHIVKFIMRKTAIGNTCCCYFNTSFILIVVCCVVTFLQKGDYKNSLPGAPLAPLLSTTKESMLKDLQSAGVLEVFLAGPKMPRWAKIWIYGTGGAGTLRRGV
jgi:hypothetical protein